MRKLVIVTQPLAEAFPDVDSSASGIFLPDAQRLKFLPFSKAKNLLGTEHSWAIYQMSPASDRLHFQLDTFAMLAGTIQRGGRLYLCCPAYKDLLHLPDEDSRRWNEDRAIACPNFYRHFQQLVSKFQVEILPTFPAKLLQQSHPQGGEKSPIFCGSPYFELTDEQQQILKHLPTSFADIHLITAPRGRGKSTLSGKLARHFSARSPVYLTARSSSALNKVWQTAEVNSDRPLHFLAPDRLRAVLAQGEIPADAVLFIDEAASLPLPILLELIGGFAKVVLTSTSQNYEGTGRGFRLKLLPQLEKRYPTPKIQHWQLKKALRFHENDPLERFCSALLLLEDAPIARDELARFYQLLADAHYQTTPSDLRRLFDGSSQRCLPIYQDESLIGGLWALKEGGLSPDLCEAIWRGERRPKGSLVAQYLCFQGNLKTAAQLHSYRISRIAIEQAHRQQGRGKQAVRELILQLKQENQQKIADFSPPQAELIDFVSVSFGFEAELFRFWQACGFEWVQLTPTADASSGLQSAMMLYPLTSAGEKLVASAKARWQRDLPWWLPDFAEKQDEAEQIFDEQDRQNLLGFAFAHRTLASCFASLKRWQNKTGDVDLLSLSLSKTDLARWRKKLADYFTPTESGL